MKKIILFLLIALTLFGCKKKENPYPDYEHYRINEKSAYIYTFHHDDGKKTYAVSDITPKESETYVEGLFYKISEDDYILIDKIETGTQTINGGNHLTYPKYNYFYLNRKLEDKLYTIRDFGYIVEYTLKDEKVTKKELTFNIEKVKDLRWLSTIEKVDEDYMYLKGYSKDPEREELNIKCSLTDYKCVKEK